MDMLLLCSLISFHICFVSPCHVANIVIICSQYAMQRFSYQVDVTHKVMMHCNRVLPAPVMIHARPPVA